MSGIFSRYSQGENRVTASILAVFRRLSLPAFEFVVSRMAELDGGLINISDQPSSGGEGIPDGEISSRFRILLETKTATTADRVGDLQQLGRHLSRLKEDDGVSVLIYLTPDGAEPAVVRKIADPRLIWKSFADLYEILKSAMQADEIVLSDTEAFLLRELQLMIENEGLLPSDKTVVVVAAGAAWPIYSKHGLYICQPNRTFRSVEYMAFYADGQIKQVVARIVARYKEITIAQLENKSLRTRALAVANEEHGNPFYQGAVQVFDLSGADDASQTIFLPRPIANDCTSQSTGRLVAFTQSQTYVSIDALKKATGTRELRS